MGWLDQRKTGTWDDFSWFMVISSRSKISMAFWTEKLEHGWRWRKKIPGWFSTQNSSNFGQQELRSIWQVLSCSATTSGGDSLWWARAGALSLVTLCVDVEVAQCGEGHSSITTGFIIESYFMIILWSYIYMYILSYITYHISRCYVRIPILGWMIIPDLAGHGLTMGWGEPMCWAKVALAPSTCATGETNQARMARDLPGRQFQGVTMGSYYVIVDTLGMKLDKHVTCLWTLETITMMSDFGVLQCFPIQFSDDFG